MSEASTLLTLTEAAERTGLTVDALRKRIRRGRLDTVKGNDGLVRVRLAAADMASLRLAEGRPLPSQDDEAGRTLTALEAAAAALHERAARAEAERDAARAEAAAERARAVQAEAEREAARIAAAAAEAEARVVREQVRAERDRAQAAEAAQDVARVELADWTAGGPLARAWRALIYRRGR